MLFFVLEIIYPRIPGALPPQDFLLSTAPEDILSLYAKYLVNLAIWAGGILTLAGLIYGGILYLLSTGKPQRMASAKEQITAAFFGLLILLSSFLILKTLSPQFINLKIPTLKQVQILQKPVILLPETTAINSSIEVEMPFGRIIEKIFETYVSDYPASKTKKTPRVERIKNNTAETQKIADKLLQQSEDLKNYSDNCQCNQTRPCCEISDPGPGCKDNACYSKPGTTSDPCKKVRSSIQKTEDNNKIEINNLTAQQIKTEEEVRSLKEWLERLKRAEKFIKECPLRSLSSLTQFYSKKDYFESQKWTIRETNFWDDVNIVFYTGKSAYTGTYYYQVPTKEIATDFATFYCAVSGAIEQQPSYAAPNLTGEESEEEAEDVLSEKMACSKESPVGEIIDRTKRTTQFLIDKLELLVSKDKELIDAVDKLQVLVSQCSSQRCYSYCYETSEGVCLKRAANASQYPEGPCPRSDIENQIKEVQRIWQEIKDIIEGEKGIVFITDEVIPEILNDLEWNVRKPMKECSSKDWAEQSRSLFNCIQTKGAIKPGGKVISECCRTEFLDNQGNLIQTPYGDCFQECFLEKGQEKHRECVQNCLDEKGQTLNDPELPLCTHELNFYCCP